MNRTITKKQILEQFNNTGDTDVFCVFCYELMAKTEDKNKIYCPNEMCLNDEWEEVKE